MPLRELKIGEPATQLEIEERMRLKTTNVIELFN